MRERIKRIGRRAAVTGFVIVGAHYGLLGGVYSIGDIRSMKADQAALVDRVDFLVSLTDSLVHRGDSLVANPEAIERVAREEYGFVRDGELLVRFVPLSDDIQAGVDD
jgi:cell division protein FtsB